MRHFKKLPLVLIAVFAALLLHLGATTGCNDGSAPAVGCNPARDPNNRVANKSPDDGIDWGAVGGVPPISRETEQTSPMGIKVYSKSGVGAARLAQADAAYAYEVARARREGGYTNFPAPATFKVFIPISCGLSPIQRTPAFKTKASASWDTNEFDIHHSYVYKVPEKDYRGDPPNCELVRLRYSEGDGRAVIWAAEQVIARNDIEGNQLAICDSEIFEEAFRNGAQHVFIATNNIPWFEATLYAQHAHPLPYQAAAQRLAPEDIKNYTATELENQLAGIAIKAVK